MSHRDGLFEAYLNQHGLALRRMDEDHYVPFFDCGRDGDMTRWFTNRALEWQREDMCAVWVLSRAGDPSTPIGFFTLSAHQIIPGNVRKNDKAVHLTNRGWVNALQNPIPAQLLGKFALDERRQGRGLAPVLMLCAYVKHLAAAEAAGAKFLVVDVREDALVAYYERMYGFKRSELSGEMAQMYRPTSAIREDVGQALCVNEDSHSAP